MNENLLLSLFEWPEYMFHLLFAETTKPEPIGANPLGVRWGFWPLYFEEYRSDREPVLSEASSGPNRIILWRPPTRTDKPAGWMRLPWQRSSVYIGYHLLTSDYASKWTKTAQYYRRKWHRDLLKEKYIIEPLQYEEFAHAYGASTVAAEIPTYELRKLRARMAQFPNSIRMWGARRISDGTIVGGHAVFDACDGRASAYSCGFYVAEERKDPVMLGLIDHWFIDALARNIKILHFGTFVPPHGGGTKRGESISHFKAQFVTDYHLYQPPLFRFVRGTIVRK